VCGNYTFEVFIGYTAGVSMSAAATTDARRIPRQQGRWSRRQAMELFSISLWEARRLCDPKFDRQVVPATNLTDAQVLTLQISAHLDRLFGEPPSPERDQRVGGIAAMVLDQQLWDAQLLSTEGNQLLAPRAGTVAAGLQTWTDEVVAVLPVGTWGQMVTTHSPAAGLRAAVTIPVVEVVPEPDASEPSGTAAPEQAHQAAGEQPDGPVNLDEVFHDDSTTLWGDPALTCLEPVVTDLLGRSSPGSASMMASAAPTAPAAQQAAHAPHAPAPGPETAPTAPAAQQGAGEQGAPQAAASIAPEQLEAIARGVTEGVLKHLYPSTPRSVD